MQPARQPVVSALCLTRERTDDTRVLPFRTSLIDINVNPGAMKLKFIIAPSVILGLASCASTTPVAGSGDVTPVPASAAGSAPGGAVRWSGSLQPTQQRTGGLGPMGQSKAFGTVSLASKGPERMVVNISLSTSLQSSTTLNWALLPGRCGSGSLPVVGVERFAVIDVGTNGRGQLTGEMALALPQSGAYHVNVYWTSGQQLSDVMTCANLRKES